MLKGLRNWMAYRRLYRELAGIRSALEGMAEAQLALAETVRRAVEAAYPETRVAAREVDPRPDVELSYYDALEGAKLEDASNRFLHATGRLPNDDELIAEYERQHGIQGPLS